MHIGIIPDGNRRWARNSNVDIFNYWKSILEDLFYTKKLLKKNHKYNFKYDILNKYKNEINEISLYLLSIENFYRNDNTINIVFELIKFLYSIYNQFKDDYDENERSKYGIFIYGQLDLLPPDIYKIINEMNNQNKDAIYKLHVAFLYDPKKDIERIVNDNHQSPIDLVIRTGGEKRSSGFFPYHILYSEWHYTNILWPEISEDELKLAFEYYEKRCRRFGK